MTRNRTKDWTRRSALLLLGGVLGAAAGRQVTPRLPSGQGLPPIPPPAPGVMNDSSRLSATPVFRHHVMIEDAGATLIEALRAELKAARSENRPVNIGAARHSQGAQALPRDGLAITLDNGGLVSDGAVYRVHAGARWHQVIAALDPIGRSPKITQSNNDFGVAAAFSVNAHGWASAHPPLGSTVRAVKMVLPDGAHVTASRSENPQLFAAAMGGYGLIGLITEVEFDSVANVMLAPEVSVMPAEQFAGRFAEAARRAPMVYGRLNIDRAAFLQQALLTEFRETSDPVAAASTIGLSGDVAGAVFRAQVGNEWVKARRWQLETGLVSRLQNTASRNSLLNNPVGFFTNRNPARTDILHEYFVAPDRFADFLDACRRIIPQSFQELLNITLRWVEQDSESTLAYAPNGPRIAAVMFFSQEISGRAEADMARMTRDLVDAVLALNGSYYLPYRPHPTLAQLRQSYPQATEFAAIKRQVDPALLLRNGLWDNYLAEL